MMNVQLGQFNATLKLNKTKVRNMQPHYVHPLSSIEVIDTDQGKKEVINNWAFASVIWSTVLAGNANALIMVNEVFPDKTQIPSLILRSKQGDEAAMREAIGILAFAIDDKLAEAFEPKGN